MNEQQQTGVITFKGNPMTLLGPDVKVGEKAPDFSVIGNDLSPVTLACCEGKTRLILTVPSLDTPVCDTEVRRFNEEVAKLDNVEVLVISMDLPFAQKRWCGAAGIENVTTASDYRGGTFGRAYGAFIEELYLDTRAIFVIGPDNTLLYKEIVSEVTAEPDYSAALNAASAAQPAMA